MPAVGELVRCTTKANAEKGIEAIKTHPPGAAVEDKTG
jgi:uncharacterized protein YegP (UPF0339 family)